MSRIVDTDQLKLMTSGDAELAAEALGIFRSQVEIWTRLLNPAEEARAWSDACHAIKGAARSVGAMELGEACETAERLGREGSPGRIAAGIAISDVKDRLIEALEALAVIEHHLVSHRTFDGLKND